MISGRREAGDSRLADLLGQRQPVHLRHLHVEDGDIEKLALAHPVQRLAAARRWRSGRICQAFDLAGEDAPVGGVVVHDEHTLALEQGLHFVQVGAGRARPPVRLDGEMEGRTRPPAGSRPTSRRPSSRSGAC